MAAFHSFFFSLNKEIASLTEINLPAPLEINL